MGGWFKLMSWLGGIAGGVLLVLYVFFFDVWRVPTDDPLLAASVEPTLTAGDVVVVTRHSSASRGNLLRCGDPQAPGRFVVARAIAQSGDMLDIRDELVSIDSRRTASPRACSEAQMVVHNPNTNQDDALACSVEEYGETDFSTLLARNHPEAPTKATVEPGKWFLISDDRHVHLDSRDYGQIDPKTCQHVIFRLAGPAGIGDEKKRFTIIW
jgi:signal peptidase I